MASWKDELELLGMSPEAKMSLGISQNYQEEIDLTQLEYDDVDTVELPEAYEVDYNLNVKIETGTEKIRPFIKPFATVTKDGKISLGLVKSDDNEAFSIIASYFTDECGVKKFDIYARLNSWVDKYLSDVSKKMQSTPWKIKTDKMLRDFYLVNGSSISITDQTMNTLSNIYTSVFEEVSEEMSVDIPRSISRYIVLNPLDYYVHTDETINNTLAPYLSKKDKDILDSIAQEFGSVPNWLK